MATHVGPSMWDHVGHEQRGQTAWSWKPQMWGHLKCHAALSVPTFWPWWPGCGAGNVLEITSNRESQNLSALNHLNSYLFNPVTLHKYTEPGEGGPPCYQPHTAALWRNWDYHTAPHPLPRAELILSTYLPVPHSTFTPRGVVINVPVKWKIRCSFIFVPW